MAVRIVRLIVAVIVAAVAIAATAPASAQPAGEAVADLGQLVLAYAADGWEVATTPDGVTLTCRHESCRGAVIDVRTVTGEPFCETAIAHDAAAVAFPEATQIGANMHVVGDLAVFLASASRGYDIDNRAAVFACVNREGVRTEFRTRVRPGEPFPAFGGGVVPGLLSGLSAPAAATREFPLGDLVFAYPADRWAEPEHVVETPTLACLPPTCDWGAELAMEAQPIAPGEACEPVAAGWSGAPPPEVALIVNPAGLKFQISRIESMCRAWSPSQYVACGIHGETRYILATDGGAGCYFGPIVGEAALLDLIDTIRPEQAP